VNDSKPEWVIDKVKLAVAEHLQANPDKTAKEVTVACFGLAFKPDIDDLRESPAVAITKRIANEHPGRVFAVEPNISELPAALGQQVEFKSIDEALSEATIVLLLVDHKVFKALDKSRFETVSLIDTRGVWGK